MPKIDDIIQSKKANLKTDIQGTVAGEKFKEFLDVADFLMEDTDPREIIAGLLRINYEHDFSQKGYEQISEMPVGRGGNSGQSRLFIAVGKGLGYSARSLLDLIEKESKVPANKIDDMRIMDDFSFVSVSHDDAEKIIDAFADKVIDGKKSIVNRAKDDNRGGSGRKYG